MREVQDHELAEKIPVDYGVGIKFTYSNCRFETVRDEGPLVKLDISSWVGISSGAKHVYGFLQLPDLMAKCLSVKRGETLFRKGQISGGSCVWQLDLMGKIRLTRPVTKADKKLDDGNTFNAWSVGDPTNRFDTEDLLLAKAKKEFKRIFAEGWTLYIEKMRQINKKGEPEFWETYKEILVKPDER